MGNYTTLAWHKLECYDILGNLTKTTQIFVEFYAIIVVTAGVQHIFQRRLDHFRRKVLAREFVVQDLEKAGLITIKSESDSDSYQNSVNF